MQYSFEWDSNKAKTNTSKHGVSFGLATEIFLDMQQLTVFDHKHSTTEERWITLGKLRNGTLLVVVHTFMEHAGGATIRIISARQATRHEQYQYEEN